MIWWRRCWTCSALGSSSWPSLPIRSVPLLHAQSQSPIGWQSQDWGPAQISTHTMLPVLSWPTVSMCELVLGDLPANSSKSKLTRTSLVVCTGSLRKGGNCMQPHNLWKEVIACNHTIEHIMASGMLGAHHTRNNDTWSWSAECLWLLTPVFLY